MVKKIKTLCFSPTGTSRKNMMAVVEGIKDPLNELEFEHIDFTYNEPEELKPFETGEVVIFSVPVYGGYVAPTALKRMDKVKGNGITPAILIVTYGNRNFEKSLLQLEEFVRERGFLPIAGAALVGEHSYSNAQTPIAVGRPDAKDLASAREFGHRLWSEKLSSFARFEINNFENPWDISMKRMPTLKTPFMNMLRFVWFVLGYQRKQKKKPVKVYPSASPNACTHCGECVDLCPTKAIAIGSEEVTDANRCIRCCACVKGCPSGARAFDSPFAKPLSENFQMRREPLYIF